MYFATESKQMQILTWFIWAVACLVLLLAPRAIVSAHWSLSDLPAWAAVVTDDPSSGSSLHWQSKVRWRKWAWRRYCAWRRAHRRALWMARLARLALSGALSLAQVVDLVTQAQFRQHLGALPVLYALLESLQVRAVINRHCPTRAEVDHGTVALVLVLNRLVMPLPIYRIADWIARTVLVRTLGIPAAKFNDDRLARTLDAIQPHCRAIWQEVVDQALVQSEIDLSVLFYDLTAFVVHGTYASSNYVDFGFAHNTPMGKRKFKVGLSVTADGRIVVDYRLWSGRTADMATVEENIARLKRLLQRQGWFLTKTIIVGDRANIDDKLAVAYDKHGLHYLAGLRLVKKVHQALVTAPADALFYAQPLTDERGPEGYWGILCQVPFEDKGSKRKVVHRGLVILSGPMRTALGQGRATKLQALDHKLHQVEAQIGQPRMRTVKAVQQRANGALRASPVGTFVSAKAYADEQRCVRLRWQVDEDALRQAMYRDGRYLLVTNDRSLSPQQMLALYHQKDGVEKRICVSKRDLKVSPVYLHKDERIEAMLLVNMLALLAYSTLERQVRQRGLQITTRHIIEKLESLDVIETHCVDGSHLLRLVPVDEEQIALLHVLVQVLKDLRLPRAAHPWRLSGGRLLWALPPPTEERLVA
jgi:transposase